MRLPGRHPGPASARHSLRVCRDTKIPGGMAAARAGGMIRYVLVSQDCRTGPLGLVSANHQSLPLRQSASVVCHPVHLRSWGVMVCMSRFLLRGFGVDGSSLSKSMESSSEDAVDTTMVIGVAFGIDESPALAVDRRGWACSECCLGIYLCDEPDEMK